MIPPRITLLSQLFRHKNIWLTTLAFLGGLLLQLADTTLILLVLGVGLLSSWWYWRPATPNTEALLILETLQTYPAVTIKHYTHLIAFRSVLPILVAAYSSSVPISVLKHYLRHKVPEIGGIQLSIGRVGLEVFLMFQCVLTSRTEPKIVLKNFQSLITFFEVQFQCSFPPAERYQVLSLFGLERYLTEMEHKSSISEKSETKKRFKYYPLASRKLNRVPLLMDSRS